MILQLLIVTVAGWIHRHQQQVILRRHHIDPAPKRGKGGMSWTQFIKLHWEVLAATQTVTNVAQFARRAEELGFDMLGCGEHVMFHGPVGNTVVSLSVAAGATGRIKLLSSIVLLPLYPAALAAKLGAALDVASNGRYNFGVGVGGEFLCRISTNSSMPKRVNRISIR